MSDIEVPLVADDGGDFGFDLRGQFLALLKSQGVAARDDLIAAADKVADYAVEQSAQLVPLVLDAGFMLAVSAAADNVIARSGLRLVATADATDARFIGLLEGGLAIAARALSAGLV